MRAFIFAFTASLVLVAAATTAPARNPWEGQPIHGKDLLSRAERKTYWRELQALETVEEQEAYWRAHVERVEKLALERGVALPKLPKMRVPDSEQRLVYSRPPYFEEIHTPEERAAYHETLDALKDPAERNAFIRNHIEKMRARGLARGLSLPSTANFAYVFESEGEEAKTAASEDDAVAEGEGVEESEALDVEAP